MVLIGCIVLMSPSPQRGPCVEEVSHQASGCSDWDEEGLENKNMLSQAQEGKRL